MNVVSGFLVTDGPPQWQFKPRWHEVTFGCNSLNASQTEFLGMCVYVCVFGVGGWGACGRIQDPRKCTGIMRLGVRAQNRAKSDRSGPKHTRLQTTRLCRELVFNIMEIALVNAASDTIAGTIKH